MLVLTIRTDNPQAEIGLYKDGKQLVYETWQAHRQLAETIHTKIATILQKQHAGWQDIRGVVCFKGPGSFTGLRIGLTVGNTLAYSLEVPVVGTDGKHWIRDGLKRLAQDQDDTMALPEYDAEAHITKPRK